MTIAKQWETVKSNWLLIVIVLAVFFLVSFGSTSFSSVSSRMLGESSSYDYARAPSAGGIVAPYPDSPDFAPDVTDRKLTKTASLSTEVERGTFKAAEARAKGILAGASSILLSENVGEQGSEQDRYLQGWYQVKVPVSQYDSTVAQLKQIGDVQSFSENTDDITAEHVSLQTMLDAERTRLARYQEMYAQATKVEDKLAVSDRIFNEEQQIKYLEDALTNANQRVDYSTINFTITEERSGYAGIALIKLSDLARNLVSNLNALLSFVVGILPWAIGAALVWFIWKRLHR